MYQRRFYFIILVYANLKMEYDTKDKTFWKRKGNDMKVLLGAVNAKYIHSNLAVYCLKAYAEKYGDTSDEISIGEYTINQQLDEILRDIYKRKPDMLCLSCYIWNLTYVEEICREIKKVMPQIIIWIGGPEVSYDGVKVLERLPEVDGVMKGEGEQTFCDLLHFYQEKTADGLQNMKGIVYREQTGQIVENEWRKTMDLSKVPFVYETMELFEHKIIYYETSRGCPFSCSYCLSSIDKCLRFRDLELVKKELQFFIDHKVPQVKFVDRTFNCKHDHAMTVWRYIKEHDNGITNFHFEVAADLLNEEEMELIKTMRPGLIQLEIGVQSTNLDTIREIHRTMKFEQVAEVVRRINSYGNVHQHLDLIAGLPYENYESFMRSFDDVYRMRPDQLQMGFLKVLKGSYMEEQVAAYDLKYRGIPPYEVLSTKWLPYSDVIRLKGVEDMVEVYYNSGQFPATMKLLEKKSARPSEIFTSLAEYYEKNGLTGISHSRLARYEILYRFLEEKEVKVEQSTPAAEDPAGMEQKTGAKAAETAVKLTLADFRDSLMYDLYVRENIKSRPSFASDQSPYKKEVREFFMAEEESPQWLTDYAGFDSKQMAKMAHLEHMEDGTFVLFDYKNRDPLSGNARAVRFRYDQKGSRMVPAKPARI